jgi:hypothetical protein
MRRIGAAAILVMGALSVPSISAPPAGAPQAQCSRNADDIKAAVVIQKENGEFCALDEAGQRAQQAEMTAYYAKFNAPPLKDFDPIQPSGAGPRAASGFAAAGDPRDMMLKIMSAKCAMAGSDRSICERVAAASVDAGLAELRAKCAVSGLSPSDCDAAITQEVLSQLR